MKRWIAAALFATAIAFAQDEPASFTSETREVTLYVSVLDRAGRVIPNIPRSSFKVSENGREQELKYFRREDVPVSLCLLIDSSGSMKENYNRVVTAALALVRASNPDDEVCFITFNDQATLGQGFTGDAAKLEQAMSAINSQGSTAVRDAVSIGLAEMTHAARDKKVLVIVSDGADNVSLQTEEDVIRRTRDSGVLVYSIGLLSNLEKFEEKDAKRLLDHLTEGSGGLAFYPKTVEEVQAIAKQIAHEIRNQYMLAYTPTSVLDGSFRKLKVEVKGVGRHTVRHRPGYYAVASSR